jgi:hypothetical protein
MLSWARNDLMMLALVLKYNFFMRIRNLSVWDGTMKYTIIRVAVHCFDAATRKCLIFDPFPHFVTISSTLTAFLLKEPLDRLHNFIISFRMTMDTGWDETDSGVATPSDDSPGRGSQRRPEGCTRDELPEENTDFKNWTSHRYRFMISNLKTTYWRRNTYYM